MVLSTTGVSPPIRMLTPTASGTSMVRASAARYQRSPIRP